MDVNGNYAATLGNQGEGSDWRDGYSPDPCSCTEDICDSQCFQPGCRGYARSIEESSGMGYGWVPDDCAARN